MVLHQDFTILDLHLHNIISSFFQFVKFCVYISILTPLDLYTTLPILCKFLGHKNIEATEYYLLLAKDYFINITNKEEEYYSDFKFLKDDDNE